MYPEEMVAPMRKELTESGFTELLTAQQVEDNLALSGVSLLVVNSVCGCAAGGARPAAIQSVAQDKKPDHLLTVFAGVDTEAVDKAREKMFPFPPSSPAMAIFKDGQLVHMLERHHIEGNSLEDIVANLQEAYNQYC